MKIKVGDVFGQWEVVDLPAPSLKTGQPRVCDRGTCLCRGCGKTHRVLIASLLYNRTSGCAQCAHLKKFNCAETITHDGKTLTATEWSQVTGVDHRTIRTRLRLGWDPGEAVTTPALSERASKKITINGETRTQSQWLEHTGISRETLRQRLAKGWPLEKALSTPRQKSWVTRQAGFLG